MLATLRSEDSHWKGTEFVLAHAKATDTRRAYAKVLFRDGGTVTFQIQGGEHPEYVAVESKEQLEPGLSMGESWSDEVAQTCAVTGAHTWMSTPLDESLNAYEALYRDALMGDKSHYVTYAEVQAAYTVWDRVLEYDHQPATYAVGAELNSLFMAVGPNERACRKDFCLTSA